MNKYLIGAKGNSVVVLRPIFGELSKEDALRVAAILKCMAFALEPMDLTFEKIEEEVLTS